MSTVNQSRFFLTVLLLIIAFFPVLESRAAKQPQTIPVPGMVTLVDLGARSCIPCKMMAPILDELEKEYLGKAAVIFIDVWQDEDAGKRYGVQAIPTQIFFDKKGKEVSRHTGFMEKQAIVDRLEKMLKE
jgi:thioredoxin 1